jgi:hypothetical protein
MPTGIPGDWLPENTSRTSDRIGTGCGLSVQRFIIAVVGTWKFSPAPVGIRFIQRFVFDPLR